MAGSTIRRLPDAIIRQLAAGEVVENPATVVRELIANAIDAGATSIEVRLRRGGLAELIVADDGLGILPDDLSLVFEPHATSKLPGNRVDSITGLGFRGEALASIASVARVSICSRHADADCGWEISKAFGEMGGGARPHSVARGTRVRVSDIFAAHPARLRFMKNERAELTRVRAVVQSFSLAHPRIAFSLVSGHRELLRVRPGTDSESVRSRLSSLLDPDFAERALEVGPIEEDGMQIFGHILPGAFGSTRRKRFHLSVNGHPVIDRGVHHAAVRSAVRHATGRELDADCVINLHVPPDQVNVNVHPRKEEVRFVQDNSVVAFVRKAVVQTLEASGFSAAADLSRRAREAARRRDAEVTEAIERPLGRLIGQAHGSWIVCETRDGIAVVDQHAAHERMLLEEIRGNMGSGADAPAALPCPLVCVMPFEDQAAVLEHVDELERAGFRLVSDGNDNLLVSHVPGILRHLDPRQILREFAALVAEGEADLSLQVFEVVAAASCRAAIKAGDELDAQELEDFVRRMEATPNATRCIHGRPSVVFLSNRDLAGLFGRM